MCLCAYMSTGVIRPVLETTLAGHSRGNCSDLNERAIWTSDRFGSWWLPMWRVLLYGLCDFPCCWAALLGSLQGLSVCGVSEFRVRRLPYWFRVPLKWGNVFRYVYFPFERAHCNLRIYWLYRLSSAWRFWLWTLSIAIYCSIARGMSQHDFEAV